MSQFALTWLLVNLVVLFTNNNTFDFDMISVASDNFEVKLCESESENGAYLWRLLLPLL